MNAHGGTAFGCAVRSVHVVSPALCSAAWCQTAPVGFDSPRMFYNQVACFTTPLTASQVRECLKKIERDHGRTADDKARGIVKIDIDLLCYDGEVLKPQDWLRVDVREGVARRPLLKDGMPTYFKYKNKSVKQGFYSLLVPCRMGMGHGAGRHGRRALHCSDRYFEVIS